MKRSLKLPALLRLTLLLLIVLMFQNCADQNIKESTDETLNITSYLRENEEYSMFVEILDLTNYSSFMDTYGTYTLFLPTNNAIKQYLADIGVSSLKDVPLEDLQNIAKLHIIDQKIATTSFTDGKIASPTMYGQFLITGAININGSSSTTINKTSKIVASNIEVGNGYIHVIDKMLRIADKTLAQTVEENQDLSLFTEVLKITGWYDKLNQPLTYNENNIGSHLTVLAQTNKIFSDANLGSLDLIKKRYSNLGDPMNPKDSLNLFVQYHVLPNLNYLADLATTQVFETKAPLEVISSKLEKTSILLNNEVFNGVLEPGVGIIRELSDVTCSNGTLHFVDGNFSIKKRLPAPVYFDLCDQPEFAANVANYRKPGGLRFQLGGTQMTQVTWEGNQTQGYGMSWVPSPLTYNGDWFEVFRFRDGSGGVQNITFTTPVIIKGRYKIWISYRQNGNASTATKVFFDDVQTSRLLNMREYANAPSGSNALSDKVLESQGYKRYIYPYTANTTYSRLVGIVEVTTTGKHKLRLNSQLASNGNGNCYIDMIEFRPVEMDQIWPKFKAGLKTGVPDNVDLNGDGLIQRSEAPFDNSVSAGY